MKYLILSLAAICMVPLAGCTGGAVQSTGDVAAASADDLYTHASASGEVLVKAGALDKAAFKAADAKAYAVLLGIRAGTSTLADLNAAIAIMLGAAK